MMVTSGIFEPGSLVNPIAASIRRKDGPPPEGLGEGNPGGLYIIERDGTVRPANRAERRLATRTNPALRRAGA